MNLIQSSKQLKAWDEYREFLKVQLRMIDSGGTCWVSKEKIDFEVEGKPWRGHALLAGPKAELAIKGLRKEGLLFREGLLKREGQELAVAGLQDKLVTEAGKTMLKLKLGWKISAAEEGAGADLEASWSRLKAALMPRIQEALSGNASAGPQVKPLLQQALDAEKQRDFGEGIEVLKSLAKFLTGGGQVPGGDGAAAMAETPEEAENLQASGKSIRQPVGEGGVNDAPDVTLVQRWLNNHGIRARVSGQCDSTTIEAIKKYQGDVLKFRKPDGLVEPRGQTERQLKRKPVKYDGTAETETEQKLQEFLGAFDGIAVRVNPGKQPPEYVDVVPPYHINSKARKANALEARKKNPGVTAVLKQMPALARVGKADPDDIQFFLEECIKKGLVKSKTQKGLRDFLALYGVSTDCSGLVGQALNYLTDGNLSNEDGGPIDLMNTGAGSMKGGRGEFTKVTKPSALRAGDTMHLPGHIRILVDVDHEDGMVLFRTIESTPTEDVVDPSISDGRNNKKAADGGVGDILWRYDDPERLAGLQRSPDGGRSWKRSSDSNVTYGRWKKMPPSA